MTLEEASARLSNWLTQKPADAAAQKAALEHYGKLFRPDNIVNLTEEQFKGFLLIKNNKHWTGIHRQSNIYADMERLKNALKVLLDESEPIQVRLDKITNGPLYIKGLGRAVLTPILMCAYPDKYAVYNRISEEGLTVLGRNNAKATDTFGKRYVAINDACHQISDEIKQPLSLVDAMFSFMVHGLESPLVSSAPMDSNVTGDGDAEIQPITQMAVSESFVFPLEKYLEDFLVSNWDKTALGKSLALHVEDEESATQYSTDLGPIDILARDKSNQDWVVIELKKGKSSDTVIGQLLRYMGWVKKHKAANGESVRGIIITGAPDDRIKYAMLVSHGISFYTYKVSFDLMEEKPA
jgi:Endonuclease NucS